MGSLGRVGRHTTALVGREVKRTFSEFCRFSTGLPDRQAREAGGQNVSNLRQVIESLIGHVGDQTREIPPLSIATSALWIGTNSAAQERKQQ